MLVGKLAVAALPLVIPFVIFAGDLFCVSLIGGDSKQPVGCGWRAGFR